MSKKVLIIEDDAVLRESIKQMVELEDLEPIPTSSLIQARRSIRSNFDGVILSDIRMPDQDGFDVLRHVQNSDPEIPVILITGHSDVPTAIRALREGSYDYLEKPFETDVLINSLQRALKHRSLILGNRNMSRQLERSDIAAQNFPGNGADSQNLRKALRRAALTHRPVHLYGENGSGKRTAAYVIHELSQTDRVFETLNCQSATPDSIEQTNFDRPTTLSIKNEHLASVEFQTALKKALTVPSDIRLITTSIHKSHRFSDVKGLADPITIYVPSLYERQEDIHEIFAVCLRQTARATGIDMPMFVEETQTFFLNRDIPKDFFQLRRLVDDVFAASQSPNKITLTEKLENYETSLITKALKSSNGRVVDAAVALGIPRNTLYDRMSKFDIVAKDYHLKVKSEEN